MATELELAWAAGLFEGEGCFTVSRRQKSLHGVKTGQVYGQMVATMTMSDEDVVRRFHKIIGFGNFYALGAPRPGTKKVWRWCVQSRDGVRTFYDLVKPWLGERRLLQGQQVLDTPRGDISALHRS